MTTMEMVVAAAVAAMAEWNQIINKKCALMRLNGCRARCTLTGGYSLRVGSGVSEVFFRRGGATGIDNSPFGGSGGLIFDCITIA